MLVIFHKDEFDFLNRVESKVFAERDGWGGEVRSLRNEMKTVKNCWGKWDWNWKQLWETEGPAAVRPRTCGHSENATAIRGSSAGAQAGKSGVGIDWGQEFCWAKRAKDFKKKIVAREWLTWWTIEIRLEMKPGKGRSHLIDAAWRFFCSQRGLQVVKGVWTRGKVLLVHKGDQRGVYGGFWFHTSIVWIKIQDTEKKYLFYCILTTTLERKEWGQRRQCKRKKSWHLLNTQQVSGLC